MNILIINWQDWLNPLAGGAEVYLYEIFSRLAKKNHRIVMLCSRARGQRRHEVIDGFEIFRIGCRGNFNFFAPIALRALLRHHKIDVIIDDLNKIPFFSPLHTRKKVYAMLMHVFRSTIYRETNPLAASYVFFTERLIPFFYRNCGFIAISNSSASDLKQIGVRNDICVVQSGIPEIPSQAGAKRAAGLVAYVGRVKKYKSIDHFVNMIAGLKKHTDVRAMIVGDGDALRDLKSLDRILGTGIEFTGFVSEREKFRIYSSAMVVVQPSIKEGWGLTAIEAQACGTPVVCADSPGLNEVVADGRTGYLYPYGDIEAMGARIKDLLTDHKKWQEFSSAAKSWSARFSWDTAADKMGKILARGLSS
jgi:glycosyltransferase involved in cell wall biosynthesis